jgi:hypothetical protein
VARPEQAIVSTFHKKKCNGILNGTNEQCVLKGIIGILLSELINLYYSKLKKNLFRKA